MRPHELRKLRLPTHRVNDPWMFPPAPDFRGTLVCVLVVRRVIWGFTGATYARPHRTGDAAPWREVASGRKACHKQAEKGYFEDD